MDPEEVVSEEEIKEGFGIEGEEPEILEDELPVEVDPAELETADDGAFGIKDEEGEEDAEEAAYFYQNFDDR
jgi:hypothetical protein